MKTVCCCSMAGTDACQHCRNNPAAADVWSKTVTMDLNVELGKKKQDYLLDRICVATYTCTLPRENVTVFITRQLLCELIDEPYRPKDGMKPQLFGCDVEVIEKPGLWWAVGVKNEEVTT